MAIVSLEYLKQHVRADDMDADDEYLTRTLEEAESAVVMMTGREEEELLAMNGGEFPPMLRRAILLLAGHWYNQRESAAGVVMSEVPDALQAMVKPWRKLGNDRRKDEA